MDPVRHLLEKLMHERGETCASLSRLLGRNPAYMQQFIQRGVPRRLAEDDRRRLARYFSVDEAQLGAPHAEGLAAAPDVLMVPRLAIGASAGGGAVAGDEKALGQLGFDPQWLRKLTPSPRSLSIIQVSGDSMAPTLDDGDDIMVDRSDAGERIRDGIYVLRVEDALLVKRLAFNPATQCFAIRSDNPLHPDWPERAAQAMSVIGRVIWAGRRIG